MLNNKKRKSRAVGKVSLGGRASFSAGGRERKRARKIAKNIAKSQGAHMLELGRKLELERALAGVVDWSKDSGVASSAQALKRLRKMALARAVPQRIRQARVSTSDDSNNAITNNWRENFRPGFIYTPNSSASRRASEFEGIRAHHPLRPARLAASSWHPCTMESSKPTPIQRQLWPAALCGLDCMAVAPTGSGKTLAYLLPGVMHVKAKLSASNQHSTRRDHRCDTASDRRAAQPHMIVCVPTRELAQQVMAVGAQHLRLGRIGIQLARWR